MKFSNQIIFTDLSSALKICLLLSFYSSLSVCVSFSISVLLSALLSRSHYLSHSLTLCLSHSLSLSLSLSLCISFSFFPPLYHFCFLPLVSLLPSSVYLTKVLRVMEMEGSWNGNSVIRYRLFFIMLKVRMSTYKNVQKK